MESIGPRNLPLIYEAVSCHQDPKQRPGFVRTDHVIGPHEIRCRVRDVRINRRRCRPLFHKDCRYFHLSGIGRVYAGGNRDGQEAEDYFCPPLKISN